MIAQWFSITYGLGHRSYLLLWDVLDKLYEKRGVYKAYQRGLTLVTFPTLEDLYLVIVKRLEKLKQDRKVSFDTLDVYRGPSPFLTRLPIGWNVVRKMRTFNPIDTESVLVKWDLYPIPSLTDEELDAALKGLGPLRGDERGPEGN